MVNQATSILKISYWTIPNGRKTYNVHHHIMRWNVFYKRSCNLGTP